MADNGQLLSVLAELQDHYKYNRIDAYEPYPFQKAFHHAKDGERYIRPFPDREGLLAIIRILQCGNQVGKTFSGAAETTYHATGLYPDWWEGHRFTKPPRILVAGFTNEQTRDVCQAELLGDPRDAEALGTGAIPRHLILDKVRKAGVMNAFESVKVQHVNGICVIKFSAFEQKKGSFMGSKIDFGWMDEEPPWHVFAQFIRATISTHGKLIATFTPEEGLTELILQLSNEIKDGWSLVRAGWSDAPHITNDPKRMEQLKNQYPDFELKMRMDGEPFMGSGQVFLTPDDDIKIEPFKIPAHYRRLCGIDFGIDHPFAAAWLAMDPDTNIVYLYDIYKIKRETPPIHAAAINERGKWIPIVWPHDGLQSDKNSGVPLADHYRNAGLKHMRREKFTNPPGIGQIEGQGGIGREVGLIAMNDAMKNGTFKVFSNCYSFFEEKSTYHRKDGKIIDLNDDAISAARYAYQSMRFAKTEPDGHSFTAPIQVGGGWSPFDA